MMMMIVMMMDDDNDDDADDDHDDDYDGYNGYDHYHYDDDKCDNKLVTKTGLTRHIKNDHSEDSMGMNISHRIYIRCTWFSHNYRFSFLKAKIKSL